MKIIGAMRVKNEARWIGRVIHALNRICSRVIVFDDHSTDETRTIALAAGAVVLASPFQGFDETRDKNYLLDQIGIASWCETPWILMVDGDEELEEAGADLIAKACANPLLDSNGVDAFSLEIVYLWNDDHTRRTDLRTFCRWRPSLFRAKPGQIFQTPYPATGLHCGNIPHGLASTQLEGARLLHFGYMLKEDRIRKWKWYNQIDPENHFEDCYRHMVIGDLPELPATAVTKWGGPLNLEAL